MINKRIKFEVVMEEGDFIAWGFHSFLNKRGKVRNIIIGAFLFLLLIQSIREVALGGDDYLYVFLLLILILFVPINIYTSYRGFYKRNWSKDRNAVYTIDEEFIRVKRNKSNDKKEVINITKITESKNSIYLWWKDSFETSVIPKRFLNIDEIDFIKTLNK